MNRDEELIEAIKDSGFYEYGEVNLDDLPKLQKSAIVLAGALIPLRPDLFDNNPDVVFIIQTTLENGSFSYSLPKKSLSELLLNPPYDDSVICSYSVKDGSILRKLYKGTGTKWEIIK